MKRIALLLTLVAFVLGVVSCGGPVNDAKKTLKLMKNLTTEINKAAEDGKITDKEAEKVNASMKKFKEYSENMEKKYEKNEEAEKQIEEYHEKNKKELDEVQEQFMEALGKLFNCEEGLDKIDLDW
ncbi:MAG: hypothetical protein RBR32_03060 [Bacteroidales bacterium]|nr:hypothetical protein [Bacteroidales bacterium]